MKKTVRTKFVSKILVNLLLWLSAALFIFPLYWMVTGSFESQSVTMKFPPELFPLQPIIDNYVMLNEQAPILKWLLNSLIAALIGTLLVATISSMAAYVLARKRFYGKSVVFGIVIFSLFIPVQLLLVPLFTFIRDFNLQNTTAAVMLPFIASPFSVFLIKQLGQTLPDELFQAAKIDGCPELKLFSYIFIPLAIPAIAAAAIFSFLGIWNNYMWQLIVLSDAAHLTIPVGLATLKMQYDAQYGLQMAGSTIAFIPILIIFLLFQKYFVKGLTLGGIKG